VSLQAVLDAVPDLANALSVDPLPGGLTNTNYKVVGADGRCYVVRISNKDSGLLAIDRVNELHNTLSAAEAGVGPAVVAALPELDALVLEFLEGRTLTPDDLRAGDRLEMVADACRSLHAARPFLADFDMFEIQQRYLAVVQERGFRLPDRYLEFEPQVRAIEEAMRVRAEPPVPCNNDLLAENFIDVGSRLRLIDYEYSGNNDACFELGNIWSESNLAPHQLDELVGYYYGHPLRNKVARARLWGLVAKYGWTLWASIQDGMSQLDFDFWSWGMEKYERAVLEFDGNDFTRLVAEVQRAD
jgi:thiamine kinase-like enzyme